RVGGPVRSARPHRPHHTRLRLLSRESCSGQWLSPQPRPASPPEIAPSWWAPCVAPKEFPPPDARHIEGISLADDSAARPLHTADMNCSCSRCLFWPRSLLFRTVFVH